MGRKKKTLTGAGSVAVPAAAATTFYGTVLAMGGDDASSVTVTISVSVDDARKLAAFMYREHVFSVRP